MYVCTYTHRHFQSITDSQPLHSTWQLLPASPPADGCLRSLHCLCAVDERRTRQHSLIEYFMLIKNAGSSSIMFSYLIQPMAMFSTNGHLSDVYNQPCARCTVHTNGGTLVTIRIQYCCKQHACILILGFVCTVLNTFWGDLSHLCHVGSCKGAISTNAWRENTEGKGKRCHCSIMSLHSLQTGGGSPFLQRWTVSALALVTVWFALCRVQADCGRSLLVHWECSWYLPSTITFAG